MQEFNKQEEVRLSLRPSLPSSTITTDLIMGINFSVLPGAHNQIFLTMYKTYQPQELHTLKKILCSVLLM